MLHGFAFIGKLGEVIRGSTRLWPQRAWAYKYVGGLGTAVETEGDYSVVKTDTVVARIGSECITSIGLQFHISRIVRVENNTAYHV
jgi:hypothetical protein